MLDEETTADDNHFNAGRHETCCRPLTLRLTVAKLRYDALQTLNTMSAAVCCQHTGIISIIIIIVIIIITHS